MDKLIQSRTFWDHLGPFRPIYDHLRREWEKEGKEWVIMNREGKREERESEEKGKMVGREFRKNEEIVGRVRRVYGNIGESVVKE